MQMDNMSGVTRILCYLSVLSQMKQAIPGKTKMNQEEDFVSVGEPFSKHAWKAPRHHQHENILRYVQQALNDIRWTIDQAEFDDLLAFKKDSALGPDAIPHVAYRCAAGLGSKFLFNAYRAFLGGAVPDCFTENRSAFIPRLLTSMTLEGSFDLQTHFAR